MDKSILREPGGCPGPVFGSRSRPTGPGKSTEKCPKTKTRTPRPLTSLGLGADGTAAEAAKNGIATCWEAHVLELLLLYVM